MPEFQRGNSTAYLNPAPPLDPKAASFYAVSPPPRDWDDRRVRTLPGGVQPAMMQILTIHEAYPGHYVQLEYSNRHPSLIRKVLYSGTFAEGWAVYTEQMMLDQGFGDGDLSLRLNQLKFYLRAVTNAILDHQMHCTQHDRRGGDGAADRSGRSSRRARRSGKIVRAKQSSAASSRPTSSGRMAFYRLRQQVQREQGDAFDLGRYHEAVLAHGTLPVKFLPELVPGAVEAAAVGRLPWDRGSPAANLLQKARHLSDVHVRWILPAGAAEVAGAGGPRIPGEWFRPCVGRGRRVYDWRPSSRSSAMRTHFVPVLLIGGLAGVAAAAAGHRDRPPPDVPPCFSRSPTTPRRRPPGRPAAIYVAPVVPPAFRLLAEPAVQADIGLTAAQKAAAEKVRQGWAVRPRVSSAGSGSSRRTCCGPPPTSGWPTSSPPG